MIVLFIEIGTFLSQAERILGSSIRAWSVQCHSKLPSSQVNNACLGVERAMWGQRLM